MRGSRPITSVACSTSSRTSAATARCSWPAASRAAWVDRAGVAIRGLHTPYGTLSYSLVRTGERIAEMTLSASGRVPPGGFVLAGPWPRPLYATVNGRPVAITGDELRIDELEAKVVLQLGR